MADQPLLTYRLATSPAPLQASTPDTAAQGRITLAVTPGDQDTYVESVQIAVPADGLSGGAYFAEQPDFSSDDDQWVTGSAVQVSAEHLGLDGDAQFYRAIFHYRGDDSQPVSGTVHLGVSGPLGDSTGTLELHISERSGPDPDELEVRRRTVPLVVTAPVFYLQAFLARSDESATVPKTKFAAGNSPYLSWESNGAYFRVYGGDGQIVHQGPETFFTLDARYLTMDTTYTVEASMSPGGEGSGSSFEQIYQYATLTLTVTDPTLAGLTVQGGIEGQSGLKLSGAADLRSTLAVGGSVTADSELTVFGSVSARGDIDVNGDMTVYSTLDVNGTLKANGDLGVNGTLTANGQVEAVGGDHYVRIRELRGPYGEHLHINSAIDVLSGCDVTMQEHLNVIKDIKINGHGVLSDKDNIGLYNNYYGGYLYASTYEKDSDRRIPYVWVPGNRVDESHWQISRD
ncbi:hypothetical protein AB0D49_01115 [Streptomyces sp. NPDC048290]|uniref:hypothetical protein n=1 Tax=Streptomyces sp. NPDC048290 TaxID=3155811 RepID=UPI003427CE61